MNACTEFRHLLLLYAGEDLEPLQLDAVRGHLAECASCSAVTAAARRAREAYRAGARRVENEEIDLWPAIRSRIRAEVPRIPAPLSAGPSFGAATRPATQEPAAPEPARSQARSSGERALAPTTGRLLSWTAGLAAAAAVLLFARVFLFSGAAGGPAYTGEPIAHPSPSEAFGGTASPLVEAEPESPGAPVPGASRPLIPDVGRSESSSDLVASEVPETVAPGLIRVQDPKQRSLREVVGASGSGVPQWIELGAPRDGDAAIPASNELR